MSQETVKDNRSPYSGNSQYNAISFMIENTMRQQVNTADVVVVTAVEAGGSGSAAGYVTVKPLVCQVDNFGEIIQPVENFKLPYSRVQGGIAAIVIDPEPGDIGIAVYAKRDSTNVSQGSTDPVQPGSFRMFDQSDGFYIGGFLNKAPTIFLELDQDNNATLTAPTSVTVNTQDCTINAQQCTINSTQTTINASDLVTVNTPTANFTGNVNVEQGLTWGRATGLNGGRAVIQNGLTVESNGIQNTGGIQNSGASTTSNGIVLETHIHSGVETGGGNTGGPQ